MYNNQGFKNYRVLVNELLEALEEDIEYEFDLSNVMFMISQAYEALKDRFPEGEICLGTDREWGWKLTIDWDLSYTLENNKKFCISPEEGAFVEDIDSIYVYLEARKEEGTRLAYNGVEGIVRDINISDYLTPSAALIDVLTKCIEGKDSLLSHYPEHNYEGE